MRRRWRCFWPALAGALLLALPAGSVPPAALLVDLLPPPPRQGDPVLARPELRAVNAAVRARRWTPACEGNRRLLAGLFAEGSRIFYGPDRGRGDAQAIERFVARHVLGPGPLLEEAGEVFVPAGSWRRLAAWSCVRAGQHETAESFLYQAAAIREETPVIVALAAVRLGRGLPEQAGALLGERGGGTRAELVRALAAEGRPAAEIAEILARARRTADLAEIGLVERVERYLRGPQASLRVPSAVAGP